MKQNRVLTIKTRLKTTRDPFKISPVFLGRLRSQSAKLWKKISIKETSKAPYSRKVRAVSQKVDEVMSEISKTTGHNATFLSLKNSWTVHPWSIAELFLVTTHPLHHYFVKRSAVTNMLVVLDEYQNAKDNKADSKNICCQTLQSFRESLTAISSVNEEYLHWTLPTGCNNWLIEQEIGKKLRCDNLKPISRSMPSSVMKRWIVGPKMPCILMNQMPEIRSSTLHLCW